MRAKHFFALLAAGLTTVVMAAGCGPGDDTNTGGGGTGGDGGSGAEGGAGGGDGGAGGTGGTTSNPTTSTPTGDGNDSFEQAEELILADDNFGTLEPADSDSDYFWFDGEADAPFILTIDSKPARNPFDTTYPDVVITLYDENRTQIARNDDPTPRFSNDSEIFTILPAAGKYYVEVSECTKVFGPESCADPALIENFDYTLSGGFLNDGAETVAAEAEPNNTQGQATDITEKYLEIAGNPGLYAITTPYGRFEGATDVDVFKFRIPVGLNYDPATERSVAYFYITPSSADGNGSDAKVGELWITDDAGVIIARIDNAVSSMEDGAQDLSPPLEIDKDYFLFVKAPAGADGTNDFYFLRELVSGSNPIELDDAGNDTAAGAEELFASPNDPTRYFFEGDISTDTDVDFFTANMPAGLTENQVGVVCGAQRSGSGLRGFQVTLSNDANGTAIGSATEAADKDALVTATSLNGATKVRVEIKATLPNDPSVTGTYYRCAVFFL